jgi:hypothetical protein
MNEKKAPSFARRHAKALTASIALTLGFGWVMRKGALPLFPPEGALARVDVQLTIGFVLLMLVSMLCKYGRYYFLIAPITPLSLRRVLSISGVAMALVTLLPFRLGEFARPAMLRERGKVSGWAVTGTVGAERIIDGVAFGLTLLLGLAFAPPVSPLPEKIGNLPVPAALVPRAAVIATLGFTAALIVMAIFYRWREGARRLTEATLGRVSARIGTRVADIISYMSDGFKFLTNPRYTLPYIIVTAACVLSHVWAIELLARAVGITSLSFAQSAVVVGVLALGFALPNAPGFFGAVQLALYASLVLYLAPAEVTNAGASLVFIFYLSYIGIVMGLGLIGLLVEYLSGGANQSES